jgi:predicted kinase
MIAIGGLSGSGKTTLATALQKHFTDHVVLDSDVLRKKMHGVDPLTPLPASMYTPAHTAAFIDYIRAEATQCLKNGQSVIVTGTFLDHSTRREQKQVADKCNADFIGLYLDVPVSKLFRRVAQRRDNPSDACVAILRRQLRGSRPAPEQNHRRRPACYQIRPWQYGPARHTPPPLCRAR